MVQKGITVSFTVLWEDTPVAEIHINNGKPQIIKLVPDGVIQPFGGSRQDMMRVYDFLESRCYENGRADLPEILSQANLQDNNPWEWVKVSHGVTWDDFWWIRFEGEDIIWKDVRVR
ncbi:MAG: hypothetical protein LUE16_10640 [Lachnospiraceae bacterium]|nr:hypothetical protein [Lachnospiraceae bacterium]